MTKPKLSPREIVQRLQMIDALTIEGMTVAEAVRSAGVLQAEYDRWRVEYNGLRRTLGPLICAPPRLMKTTRRATSALRASRPSRSCFNRASRIARDATDRSAHAMLARRAACNAGL